MIRTGAIAVVLSMCAASASTGTMQGGPVQPARLDPRIGLAVPQRYESIRDGKDWENPKVLIHRNGIDVIAKALVSGRKSVAAAELQQALIELPVAAWPYGRVVAVFEPSIRAGDGSDEKPVADNLKVALEILKKLEITADRWPS